MPKTDIELKDFKVKNEPVLSYLAGSSERKELEQALQKFSGQTEDCPIVIGEQEYRTDDVRYQVMVRSHSASWVSLINRSYQCGPP